MPAPPTPPPSPEEPALGCMLPSATRALQLQGLTLLSAHCNATLCTLSGYPIMCVCASDTQRERHEITHETCIHGRKIYKYLQQNLHMRKPLHTHACMHAYIPTYLCTPTGAKPRGQRRAWLLVKVIFHHDHKLTCGGVQENKIQHG